MGKAEGRVTIPRYTAFTYKPYAEDEGWDKPLRLLMGNGYPVAYILHDKDVYLDPEKLPDGKQLGDADKTHYHCLIRVPNPMTISAFCKNCEAPERQVQGIGRKYADGITDWRSFAVYMPHWDKKSRLLGKHRYNPETIQGNYRNEVIQTILVFKKANYNHAREDEASIVDIVNYIESFSCSLPTSQLVRWCSENGLYSVYRRSSGIIRDVLREHNDSCNITIHESLWELRLQDMEKRVDFAESQLEKAYGDLFERERNPWTGRTPAEDEMYRHTVAELNRRLREIQKGA